MTTRTLKSVLFVVIVIIIIVVIIVIQVRLVDVLGNNPSGNNIITLVRVTDANDKITAINKPFTANKDIYYYQLYDVINKPGTYTVTVR